MMSANRNRKRKKKRKRKTVSTLTTRSLTIHPKLANLRIGGKVHLNSSIAECSSALLVRTTQKCFPLNCSQSRPRLGHCPGLSEFSLSFALNSPKRTSKSKTLLWVSLLILQTILACSSDGFDIVDSPRANNLSSAANNDQSIGGLKLGGQVLVQTAKQGIFKGVVLSDSRDDEPTNRVSEKPANVVGFLGKCLSLCRSSLRGAKKRPPVLIMSINNQPSP